MWEKIKLGTLLTESRVFSENPDPEKRIRVKLNVSGIEKRPFENEVKGATKQFVRKAGQFIYGKQNFHKGAFGVIPKELDGFESSMDIPSFDVSDNCLAEWIYYYFKQGNTYKHLEKLARGVGSKRIHPEQIFELEIPLPDLSHQKELVEIFHRQEQQFLQLSEEHESQQSLLKKLRQQILQDAVQGKLLPQNKNDEPASELLNRIKAEKEKLIAESKLRKEKPLPPIKEEDIPFTIPKNWVWCRLGEIIENLTYGTSVRCDYNDKRNSSVLRIPNVSDGFVNIEDLKYADLGKSEKEDLKLKESDLLLIRSNGNREVVGRAVYVPKEFSGFCYAGYLIRLRFGELISSLFLRHIFDSQLIREQIEIPLRTTVGVNNINSTEIKNLIIPLPPFAEQQRIVAKVELLLQQCKELEKIINQNQKYAEQLQQAVLQEAFTHKN